MIPLALLEPIIDRALEEDLLGGDLTTESTVDAHVLATASAVAKSELVVCGGDVFEAVFRRVDATIDVRRHVDDGTWVTPGTTVWTVAGRARSILIGERTALNFVQRMSGVATLARTYVVALPPGSHTRITDTRKTTPGLRLLERYAVRMGGAHNHRDMLGSAVLIKDNHIEAAGGITLAVSRARARAPHTTRVEVEVESIAALDEALAAGADIVMLDNFAPEEIHEAVRRANGRALVEVSGGITLPRVGELADAGVDAISVGALTHSAPAADISLDIRRS